jgi:hypothetical protein
MPARRLKAALFAAAIGLIDLADGKADAPVIVRVERGKTRLQFETNGETSESTPDDGAALRAAFFTHIERKIVQTLSNKPLKQAAVVEALADEGAASRTTAALAALVERGVLVVTRSGYAVADTLFSGLAASSV